MTKISKTIIGLLIIVLSILAINYISLQRHMGSILAADSRNKGLKVWVHYKWFINPTQLEYDLRSISGENSTADVTRIMLQFSEKIKNKNFDKVVLAYKGSDKFYFKGDYFQKLGNEYEFQNPIYTLRTIPENVYSLGGGRMYGAWTGGWLGVMGKQMEDLNNFAKDWYLDDVIKELN
ncbi:hypothetical protein HLH14_12555 [Acinetobacter sp. ANC 4282]|uniref:hypothetical protein n=1 Tax=Acinetobacter terrae TaxID=2731247 RepID=UPI0014906216|nr:hypothetical protein [Acinetobacter terrae]NNH16802.1 hypothetical protein [Acinetobacter terrae]